VVQVAALAGQLRRLGMTDAEVGRVFATFNVAHPALATARRETGAADLRPAPGFCARAELTVSGR